MGVEPVPLPGTGDAGSPGARHPRGPLPKQLLLSSELQNPHRKSMARGNGPQRLDEPQGVSGPRRWVDVAGRALRRTWMSHWRRQYVEILPLAGMPPSLSPPPRPPRAVRSHHRWRGPDRLARNAWSGPPHQRITEAFIPTFLASN